MKICCLLHVGPFHVAIDWIVLATKCLLVLRSYLLAGLLIKSKILIKMCTLSMYKALEFKNQITGYEILSMTIKTEHSTALKLVFLLPHRRSVH